MKGQEQITIYETEDGKAHLVVCIGAETIWLSQSQMSLLFQRERSVVTKHINNVFKEKELDKKSNVQILHIGLRNFEHKFYYKTMAK